MFPRAHIEMCRGTPQQNIAYCIKEGNFFESGIRPHDPQSKGKKAAEMYQTWWADAKAGKIEDNLNPVQVKTWEYIRVKYGSKPVSRDILHNLWIWGNTGVGKSRTIRDILPPPLIYSKPVGTEWFDNYDNQPILLLDDVDPGHYSNLRTNLKIWADHYAFNAQVKGGTLFIRPLIVIITSQYSISEVFPASETSKREEKETQLAISRRFESRIHHINSDSARLNLEEQLRSLLTLIGGSQGVSPPSPETATLSLPL